MLDFTLSGKDFFDALPQPVLLCGPKIKYCNPAAAELLAQQHIALGEALPKHWPQPKEAPCTATLTLWEDVWSVELRRLDSGTLYLFTLLPSDDEEAPMQALLGGLALQLRTQLSRTLLSTELLQRELSELEQERLTAPVSSLNKELHQLLRLSDHLDLYTRSPEALNTLFPSTLLDLRSVCKDLCEDLQSLLPDRSIQLESGKRAMYVRANRELLLRVLYNLVANSLQAGGELFFKLHRRGPSILCTLSDTGSGIDPTKLEGVYTLSPRLGRLSLGLPLCRRIAQLYGGQLMLSTEDGRTAVTLSLPLPQPDDKLRTSLPVQDGYPLLLTELSSVLPARFYQQEELY